MITIRRLLAGLLALALSGCSSTSHEMRLGDAGTGGDPMSVAVPRQEIERVTFTADDFKPGAKVEGLRASVAKSVRLDARGLPHSAGREFLELSKNVRSRGRVFERDAANAACRAFLRAGDQEGFLEAATRLQALWGHELPHAEEDVLAFAAYGQFARGMPPQEWWPDAIRALRTQSNPD
ncbi:MAG: hypothetical protein HY360_14665 [Verrucomicrobia bacterium]|nr:hypothetical protein [Verrucomicrobiota bacterium]